ncbi:MAG: hypothetical protein VYD64_07960 [Pseudomonadota bacterium]|nr:hypothetical protein [Pseudomonadota bacterium]
MVIVVIAIGNRREIYRYTAGTSSKCFGRSFAGMLVRFLSSVAVMLVWGDD